MLNKNIFHLNHVRSPLENFCNVYDELLYKCTSRNDISDHGDFLAHVTFQCRILNGLFFLLNVSKKILWSDVEGNISFDACFIF